MCWLPRRYCSVAASVVGGQIWISVCVIVDGRQVISRTIWKTRFFESFPTGGYEQELGTALVVPVGSHQYVFGLFKLYRMGGAFESGMATALDNYESLRRQRLNLGSSPSGRESERNHIIQELGWRRAAICQKTEDGFGRRACLTFVYFQQVNDPKSLRLLVPGKSANLGGHRVKINRVTIGFSPDPAAPARSSRFARQALYLGWRHPARRGLVSCNPRPVFGFSENSKCRIIFFMRCSPWMRTTRERAQVFYKSLENKATCLCSWRKPNENTAR